MSRAAFTLIELLVVIAIVAVLSVVVILVLNPSELLKQSRDSIRLNDLASLNTAIALFQTDNAGASLGTANTVYVSLADSSSTCGSWGLPALPSGWTYNCVSTTTLRNTDGNGWIPVNLDSISAKSPISSLPINPTNASSSGLYYTYIPGTSTFELTTLMESKKYRYGGSNDVVSNDGGSNLGLYEKGTDLTLTPINDTSGLAGYWKFDEGSGTTANDSSSNGNKGTLMNGPSWVTGSSCKVGNCLSFDANTTYVSVLFSSSLNITGPLSMTAWIKPSSGYCGPNGAGGIAGNNRWVDWAIQIICSNRTIQFETTTSTIVTITTPGNAFSFDTWNHVAFAYDGTQIVIYVDGAAKKISAMSGAVQGSVQGTGLGSDANSNSGRLFNGPIDDLRIYNRALSAAEIQTIYNATR
jgi:prepilin-type N-terminal cleavage/methylation domain-containing protein